MRVAVVLPALDEEGSVAHVVEGFLRARPGARVVVADNGSRDGTVAAARRAGAEVALEPRKGYGRAVIAGLHHLEASPPDVVVISDCDGTADPRDLDALLAPIADGTADLVLGRRSRAAPGALSRSTRLGNAVACAGLRALHGLSVHDVPPLRAATWDAIRLLALEEPTYGLPLETLAKAARLGLRVREVDARYLPRTAGASKVAGSWTGAVRASATIAALLVKLRVARARATRERAP